jgi:hypothetical protein
VRQQLLSALVATLAACGLLGALLHSVDRPSAWAPDRPPPDRSQLPEPAGHLPGNADPPGVPDAPAERLPAALALASQPPSNGGRLVVLDVRDPARPSLVGTSGSFSDLAARSVVDGSWVYVPASRGLRRVAADDPTDEQSFAPSEPFLQVRAAAAVGGHIYVAENTVADRSVVADPAHGAASRLRLLDVTDPLRPQEIGRWPLPFKSAGVAVAGGYAYSAAYDDGLRVLDIGDPTGPREVSVYQLPGIALDVVLAGPHAYVVDAGRGLRVVDVRDPRQPTEVGGFDIRGGAPRVAVAGTYAYLVDQAAGLQVLDVSDPAQLRPVGASEAPRYANDVAVADHYVYVADGRCGLRILDVRDPGQPTEIGSYRTPGMATRVAVVADRAYVTTTRADRVHSCPAE